MTGAVQFYSNMVNGDFGERLKWQLGPMLRAMIRDLFIQLGPGHMQTILLWKREPFSMLRFATYGIV